MKVIYSDQSLDSLQESLLFLLNDLGNPMKLVSEIKTHLLDRSESLAVNPQIGQKEEFLEHLGKNHRRLIEGHFKIFYRIEDDMVYITDFFDTRQDPMKMNG